MGKLTDKEVKNAISEHKDTFLQDGDGLALRVLKSGSKSWVFRYRRPADKKQDKFTIAQYPDVSLKDARKLAEKFKEQLERGINPKFARAAEYDRNAQALTLGAVFSLWIADMEKTNAVADKTLKQYKARWENHLKAALQNILATDITRGHIAAALEAMRQAGIVEETRKALTTINLMLDYATSRHLIEANPARLLKPKDFKSTSNEPRDRFLTLTEMRALWEALDRQMEEGRASPVSIVALKLLLLTGARRSEVVEMCWADVDLDAGIWVNPKTKNGKRHTIYLSAFTVSLIKSLIPFSGNGRYVFQSLSTDNHITADSLTKSLARMQGAVDAGRMAKQSPLGHLEHFTVHDIRRSASTAWGEHLKVAPHIIEKMLNHQPKDKLVKTYQRGEFKAEQKAAWLDWSEKVEAVIARDPKNVRHITDKKKA